MKMCSRGVTFMQIINAEGDVRSCSWMSNPAIGNLVRDDMRTIMHSKRANEIYSSLLDGTYANCNRDNCPWLANNEIEKHLVDFDEIPDYPNELYLAYEGVCNYSCTCCSSYDHMEETRCEDKSCKYDILEEKLKEILPHVRVIGANGRGELFASKRILKLLHDWEPLAPKEEIFVSLETNGSLFDEWHWKQIENLGQYNLAVAITIMSFEEPIYQYLSGTQLSISRLEDNLRFVKSLRDEGVINYLELATVLQEANFRQMVEFTDRCLNEFGADEVRIRPMMPHKKQDQNIQWFMDVRNPKHPYYEEYCKIMQHPIFQDKRVTLWSADLPSDRGEHPGIKREKLQKLADIMLNQDDILKMLKELAGETDLTDIFVYGIGTIGRLLVQTLREKTTIAAIYDAYASISVYQGIAVKRACESRDEKGIMFVTAYDNFAKISEDIRGYGYQGKIVNMYDLLR